MNDFPVIYRRNLPHIQPYGAILFLTYRLARSLPKQILEKLRKERKTEEQRLEHVPADTHYREALRTQIRKRIYLKYDQALDRDDTGPTWLLDHEIASLVRETILHRHPHKYDLVCFSIMPNHVHQVVINISRDVPIYDTMGKLKSYTATKANKLLKRSGVFWQEESFDHVVRSGKLGTTIQYVLNNPVNAGLVKHWQEWPYSWLNPRFGGNSPCST